MKQFNVFCSECSRNIQGRVITDIHEQKNFCSIKCKEKFYKRIERKQKREGCGKMFFNKKISRTSDCNKHHLCDACAVQIANNKGDSE